VLQPKWPMDDPSLASWQSELSQCPTMTEYKDMMAAMPHESAGGVTGLTYDMVKLWPKNMFKIDYHALTNLFNNRSILNFWQLAWLIPIATCEQPSLLDLRPLSLLETSRKVWMSITVRRFQEVFKSLCVLDDFQEGCLWGRGTESFSTCSHQSKSTRDIDGNLETINGNSYVDDLITASASHASLQDLADLVSGFTCLAGISLLIKTFRTMAINWGPKASKCTSQPLFIMPLETDCMIKYLGVQWDIHTSIKYVARESLG